MGSTSEVFLKDLEKGVSVNFRCRASLISLTSVVLVLAGCAVPATITEPNRLAGKREASPQQFSYEITNQRSISSDGETTTMETDDGEMLLKSRQIMVRLKSEGQLNALVKKYNVRVLKQLEVDAPACTVHTVDCPDNVQPKKVKYPQYLVEYSSGQDSNLASMEQYAKAIGLKGHYKFRNESDAGLFKTLLKMRGDRDANVGIEAADLNVYHAPTGAVTSEGRRISDNVQEGAPNGESFWWVGRESNNPWGTALNPAYDSQSVFNFGSGWYVKVAVIDNGFVDTNQVMPHAIIKNYGYSYYCPWGNDNFDGAGVSVAPWHGRNVSSLIFSSPGDNAGTIGAAPDAKVLLCRTDYWSWNNNACLNVALNWGAKVINMSYGSLNIPGGPSFDSGTISSAADNGTIFIASAGNEGLKHNYYPGAYQKVITVSSTNRFGSRAIFDSADPVNKSANYAKVDLWAAGVQIATAAPPNYLGSYFSPGQGGTSLSAPIVTGVVASLIQQNPTLNWSSVRYLLRNRGTAYPLGSEINGYCDNIGLNALKTLRGY